MELHMSWAVSSCSGYFGDGMMSAMVLICNRCGEVVYCAMAGKGRDYMICRWRCRLCDFKQLCCYRSCRAAGQDKFGDTLSYIMCVISRMFTAVWEIPDKCSKQNFYISSHLHFSPFLIAPCVNSERWKPINKTQVHSFVGKLCPGPKAAYKAL